MACLVALKKCCSLAYVSASWVLCSLGARHWKLHKSAKHRAVEPSKRAQQIPVNLPTPLHCVRNILCLHIPPALKKGKEPDCSLTVFYSKFCCVLCYVSAWLYTTRKYHTAKLQIFPTFILSYLGFQHCLCSISGMIMWPVKFYIEFIIVKAKILYSYDFWLPCMIQCCNFNTVMSRCGFGNPC